MELQFVCLKIANFCGISPRNMIFRLEGPRFQAPKTFSLATQYTNHLLVFRSILYLNILSGFLFDVTCRYFLIGRYGWQNRFGHSVVCSDSQHLHNHFSNKLFPPFVTLFTVYFLTFVTRIIDPFIYRHQETTTWFMEYFYRITFIIPSSVR